MTDVPFDPKAPVLDRRRRERVDLDAGYVWVWELEAADTLFILEHSARPTPAGGAQLARGDAILWQVLVSCYQSGEAGATRTFDLADLPRIQKLRKGEWDPLLAAIERVNGLGAGEVDPLTDFTAATPGINRRSSKRSASTISTA